MSPTTNSHGLRSKKTQTKNLGSKNTRSKVLVGHFALTKTAEVKDQAKEFTAFTQALQAVKLRPSVSLLVPNIPPYA